MPAGLHKLSCFCSSYRNRHELRSRLQADCEARVSTYLQRRKNRGPPLAGTVTCQLALPTRTGAFVSVVQFAGARLELACTENPALASGQLSTVLPPLTVALRDTVVLSVWFGPSKSDATIS